jgi:hypothetical protein
MKVKFHNIGKIPNKLVAAYGVACLDDGSPVSSANVTLIEAQGQGKLMELEADVVYDVNFTPAKLPAPAPAQG